MDASPRKGRQLQDATSLNPSAADRSQPIQRIVNATPTPNARFRQRFEFCPADTDISPTPYAQVANSVISVPIPYQVSSPCAITQSSQIHHQPPSAFYASVPSQNPHCRSNNFRSPYDSTESPPTVPDNIDSRVLPRFKSPKAT